MCEVCVYEYVRTVKPQDPSSNDGPQEAGSTGVSSYLATFDGLHQANMEALVSGLKWNDTALTFSFPDATTDYTGAPSSYGSGELVSGFDALNTSQRAAAHYAFAQVAEVTALTFGEITGAQGSADIRLAESSAPSTAWAYYPGNNEGGDAWFGASPGYYNAPQKGTYAWHTFLHEIGHALGLKHGHETSGNGALDAAHDQMAYSVMTYKSHTGSAGSAYTNESYGYAQSFMLYDVAALQALYGVNWTTRPTATTYSWSPTTGEMSIDGQGQGAPGSNRVFTTIWDAGGNDTIDLSAYSSNITGDLSPGNYLRLSDTQTAQLASGVWADGNIYLALAPDNSNKAFIENLLLGSGDDFVFGTKKHNLIEGRGGADRIEARGGHDELVGGGGKDRLIGGAGNDRLDGGIGADKLKGSGGADVFVLNDRSGKDVAVDFTLGVDFVDVPDNGLATLTVSNTGHLTVEYDGAWMVLRHLDVGDATLDDLLLV